VAPGDTVDISVPLNTQARRCWLSRFYADQRRGAKNLALEDNKPFWVKIVVGSADAHRL
jgi:hypothetical protein